MTGFLWASGLSLIWSIIFLLVALVIFFGIARLLAQTGIGRLRASGLRATGPDQSRGHCPFWCPRAERNGIEHGLDRRPSALFDGYPRPRL